MMESEQLFYNEIDKYPLLSKEDEIRLAKIIHESDDAGAILEARQTFINSNLKLVFKIAKSYNYKNIDVLDLIQEGTFGLITAIDKFDYKMDCKFSTYAVWWIKQAIQKYIKKMIKIIRLPESVYDKIDQIKAFKEKYYEEYQKYPDNAIIEKECNISEFDLPILNDYLNDSVSLNKTIGEDDDLSLQDIIADNSNNPEQMLINDDCNDQINQILSGLTDKERQIIIYRFGLNGEIPKTIEELSKILNVSKERIRNTERIAIKKMRRLSYSKNLKIYKEE